MSPTTQATIILFCIIGAVNVVVAWPLFHIEYLSHLHSNEASYATIAHFLRNEGSLAAWFPWWDLGMPIENTYFPFVPYVTAFLASVCGVTEINAYHKLCAFFYVIGGLGVFFLARFLCNSLAAGFAAASCWSLFSPSALLFLPIATDLGGIWLPWRLRTIVYYGEGPHNVSLALLIWAILFYLKARSVRPYHLVFLILGVMTFCANAFGAVSLIASIAAVECALSDGNQLPFAMSRAALAVLAIVVLALPWCSPALYATIAQQSQHVGGDYTWTNSKVLCWLFIGALYVMLPVLFKPVAGHIRILLLLFASIGAIPIFHYYFAIDLAPQPQRYSLEVELIVALGLGFAASAIQRLPRARHWVTVGFLVFLAWQFAQYRHFSAGSIIQANIKDTAQYQAAKWAGQRFGVQDRVLVGGAGGYLFNLFTDVPQVGSGHQPSTPNFMQSVGVFTIFSGMNAGDRDFYYSSLWLKAFGARAVFVQTDFTGDSLQPFANPGKFDGKLALIGRPSGWKVFDTGYKKHSLFRLVSRDAIVRHPPIHGLDAQELDPFVKAVESAPSLADGVRRISSTHWTIAADIKATQAIAVAMNYDPGWKARSSGRSVAVTRDGLGLIAISPQCDGSCTVELWYDGGDLRFYSGVVGSAAWAVFLAAACVTLWRWRYPALES